MASGSPERLLRMRIATGIKPTQMLSQWLESGSVPEGGPPLPSPSGSPGSGLTCPAPERSRQQYNGRHVLGAALVSAQPSLGRTSTRHPTSGSLLE